MRQREVNIEGEVSNLVEAKDVDTQEACLKGQKMRPPSDINIWAETGKHDRIEPVLIIGKQIFLPSKRSVEHFNDWMR